MTWHVPSKRGIKNGILNIAGENVRVENYVIVEPAELSQAQEAVLKQLPLWVRLPESEEIMTSSDQETQASKPKKKRTRKKKAD